MKFTKMHGAGNDYIYVDLHREKVEDAPDLARAMSDRHTGVGSDGLILIAPSRKADFRMIMYNADGSEGLMCGNGIRCIGKYVYEHGLTKKKSISIETQGGNVDLELRADNGQVNEVTVDMGRPRPIPPSFHVRADGKRTFLREKVDGVDCFVVSMGNPHCVIPVQSTDLAPVRTQGPAIETHPDFPSRVNVEFVKILAPDHVRQRTWERGSGETMACGSGACAVTAALAEHGLTGRSLRVDLSGGTLHVEYARDGRLLMTGPAVEVFSGEWRDSRRPRRARERASRPTKSLRGR